ncbi:MAG: chromate efflux transporter [Pelagibacteraceae bacterium TMED267]|nr:MAG: chromate efflux transporter [Pelagibacteraceae bacterium TMED267]|tara:strand:+ start:4926 stop:6104 length:1179 start_codon:yes stop_codon:yes gene_type:complete
MKKNISYFRLFLTFLKTGTISFGGYMMLIAMIRHEFSVRNKIIKKSKILDAITMASFLPGPMAINVASYIGFVLKGWRGAVVSFVAVLLPSFFIMVVFTHLYINSKNIPGISSFFNGVMPVVAAVIFSVAYGFYKDSKDKTLAFLLSILSFTITSLINGYISIIIPLLVCGGLNLLYNGDKIKKISNPKKAFVRVKGIIIASLVMTILLVFLNTAPIDTPSFNLSKVFANISLTLFGGGYVFIPYLDKIIVDQLGWLTEREFIDSIAMGQITPGPILITATFIGYKINGLLGAFLSTLSIFLPSSVVIIFFSRVYYFIKKNNTVKLIINGFKIGIIGLICYSGYVIMFQQQETFNLYSMIVCSLTFVALNKTKVHPIFLILISGLIGYYFSF